MNVTATEIYYSIMFVLFITGVFLLASAFKSSRNIKSQLRIDKLWHQTLESFADSSVDEIFERAGIRLSVRKYSAYRNIITIILAVLIILNLLITGDINLVLRKLIVITILYFLTTPKKEIFKSKKSPFKLFFDMKYRKRQDKLEKELTAMITQMKNLIKSNDNKVLSSDYLLTRLIPYTKISKPAFLQVQAFFMVNRRKEAAEYLKKSFNTKLADSFSQILVKLDTLPPKEFLSHLDVISKEIEEKEQTSIAYKQHKKKSRVFLLASLEIVAMLLDFGYIIMLDTLSALAQL